MQLLRSHRCFGGSQQVWRHQSAATGTELEFAIFLPFGEEDAAPRPVLFWLSGLTCTWANFDKSFVRDKNVLIETDKDTRFWKAGQPAKFADIKVGDKVRTKTHGIGKGKSRVAWEVFLDDESLIKFQSEQKAVHEARIKKEGAPGYVDVSDGPKLSLTLFNEGEVQVKQLKAGKTVRVAPAGIDRKPTTDPVEATVVEVKPAGRQTAVTLTLKVPNAKFQPTGLARLWAE